MAGSADTDDPPPTPTPSPSPAKPPPSPASSSAKRTKRCVQSRLSFGAGKSGGAGAAAAGAGAVVLPAPAAEEAAGKAAAEKSPEKGRRRGRSRKSEAAGKKPSSNKETNGLDQGSTDEGISIDESPQKKQRKGRNQDAARKVPNRKRCKVLESTDGHGSYQQLNSSQTEASPVSIDIDLNNVPSEAQEDANDVLENEDKSQVIVDLRSEAKIAAQEIRMLSSGKKIHPFFASRKVNKAADQDVLNIEDADSLCATERDPPFWPVHVCQLETSIPIHWSRWLIVEGSFLNTRAADTLENSVSFCEGFVKPLTIESNCKKMCPNQLVKQNAADHTASGMDFSSFSNEQSGSKFPSLNVIHLDDESLLTSDSSCHASLSYTKHPERILQGLPEVGQKGCQPSYYLWIDKYRPETAAQVCGNVEHVKFLSEWLKGWDERGHKKKQVGAANESINVSSCQDESDTDCSEDTSDYENVLLITGPVGCGKSAAVFACAREEGFNVIEVNTSDMRNGAYVKQKFEEATKSHGLEKWSQEEDTTSPRIDSLDPDRTECKQSVSCSTGKASNSNGHKSPAKCYLTSKLSDEAPKQVINKTLILFEDVDTVFDEDRGFISTILKIAETTKWPIILTSNKKDPSLPNLLDQLILDFKYPSAGELLSHVGMICKSEGVDVAAPQLKYIINACLGDIRRTTMLLQFWYQGRQQYTERSNKCLSSPFSLDLDAVHSTVPRMLPWDFPCKLSETVFMEIEKTILLAEEKKRQMEVSEFEALELQIITPLTKGRSAVKTRKIKKSKLKHGHSTECNDISPCKNDLDDFDDDPDISLPSDQQRTRKKKGVLLLSESDDDQADAHIAEDAKITVPEGGVFSEPLEVPLHVQGISNQFCFPSESREPFEITNSFQNQFESNLVGSISQICDTFMSQGVSCVPESSLIAGGVSASVSSDDLLSSMVSNGLSTFNNDSVCTSPKMAVEDTINVRNLMAETHKCMEDVVGETCEAYAESFGRNEQASCSTAGYQLMDECSQAGSIWPLSGKKTNDCYKVECVQDTWNRLRRCPVLPRETNHNRTVPGTLKLASCVSDFISETDLMLARCYPLINDILDPSSTPCAEPGDLSWYDKQLEMGSAYSQHALCVFSRDSQDKEDGLIDLSHELLFASTSATSLGKLISSGISSSVGFGNISHMKNPTSCISKGREQLGHLTETLIPVVPSKLSLSLRGPAFVDYLSSTCQISQLENLRLSENKAGNNQRRCRRSRHYLSSAALSLSPEGVELLAQSGCFGDRRKDIEETIA